MEKQSWGETREKRRGDGYHRRDLIERNDGSAHIDTRERGRIGAELGEGRPGTATNRVSRGSPSAVDAELVDLRFDWTISRGVWGR